MEYYWMIIAGFIAFAKGRTFLGWMLLGYIFGWMAGVVILLLPTIKDKADMREDLAKGLASAFLTRKEFKGVNNVDDLFKQLETK